MSCVVVVLPLVPVMVIHSAGVPVLSRTRQASSMSPHSGIPASAAHAGKGCVGA